jgi:hypothetical protein
MTRDSEIGQGPRCLEVQFYSFDCPNHSLAHDLLESRIRGSGGAAMRLHTKELGRFRQYRFILVLPHIAYFFRLAHFFS